MLFMGHNVYLTFRQTAKIILIIIIILILIIHIYIFLYTTHMQTHT